jgi:hypothetical protein
VEKHHGHCLKAVKSQLPRRESERRSHPLARHCDILTAIETRLSILAMTFTKYIDAGLSCFIPGKVSFLRSSLLFLFDTYVKILMCNLCSVSDNTPLHPMVLLTSYRHRWFFFRIRFCVSWLWRSKRSVNGLATKLSSPEIWMYNISLLTDGGKVVSHTHRPRSAPQKHYFSASGTHFC